MEIHENSLGEVYVEGVTEHYVTDESEIIELLQWGNKNRSMGVTDLNIQSSRSHCVFTIVLKQFNNQNGVGKNAKLELVDLAGAERVPEHE